MGKDPFELTSAKFNYKELFLVRLVPSFMWLSRVTGSDLVLVQHCVSQR